MSQKSKIHGKEPVMINSKDASERDIKMVILFCYIMLEEEFWLEQKFLTM